MNDASKPTYRQLSRALRELENMNERIYDGEKLTASELAIYRANVKLVGRYFGRGAKR